MSFNLVMALTSTTLSVGIALRSLYVMHKDSRLRLSRLQEEQARQQKIVDDLEEDCRRVLRSKAVRSKQRGTATLIAGGKTYPVQNVQIESRLVNPDPLTFGKNLRAIASGEIEVITTLKCEHCQNEVRAAQFCPRCGHRILPSCDVIA